MTIDLYVPEVVAPLYEETANVVDLNQLDIVNSLP